MKRSLFLFSAAFLLSCHHLPSTEEAQKQVEEALTANNKNDGGGTVEIHRINILSVRKENSQVKILFRWDGTYYPPPMAIPQPPEVITNRLDSIYSR